MYPHKEYMEENYRSDVGAILKFVDNGKVVSVVGDLYAIKLIMKTRELFWLQYPVEWKSDY